MVLDGIEAIRKDNDYKKRHRPGSHIASRMKAEWDLAIIWAMYQGWSNAQIGKTLGIEGQTARRHRERVENSPYLIFKYPVMVRGLQYKTTVWRCQLCGSAFPVKEHTARKHVAGHVVSPLSIKLHGLYSEEEMADRAMGNIRG